MPTPIEARRLSGADLGKTVEGTDRHGHAFAATLNAIEHHRTSTQLWGEPNSNGRINRHLLAPTDNVVITGKPSPATGPDCQANKCRACDGRALNETTDEITRCQCTCHP